MNDQPSGTMMGLIAAKIACCGLLVLVVSGAFAGLGGWLSGAGLAWLGLAGVAALAGAAYWWRQGRLSGARSPGSLGDQEARAAGHRSLASGSNRKMR